VCEFKGRSAFTTSDEYVDPIYGLKAYVDQMTILWIASLWMSVG
jgi:hypothetical protein